MTQRRCCNRLAIPGRGTSAGHAAQTAPEDHRVGWGAHSPSWGPRSEPRCRLCRHPSRASVIGWKT
ncbi:hypothetical protein FKM82_019331 [Ascaphus truei]